MGTARFERVEEDVTKVVDGVNILRTHFGKVLGLPKPDPNLQKLYIVPAEVAEKAKNYRVDLLVAKEPFTWEGGVFYKQLVNY